MNRFDTIIDALQKAQDGWQCFDDYEQALAAARELREAHADMLAALRVIVAVSEIETSFSLQTIKNCANIAIKQEEVRNEP
jgi:hypothetical protein